MGTEDDKSQPGEPREISIRWRGDIADIPTSYANHFFMSHMGPEFFLIFGVVTPPLVLPGDEYQIEELEAMPVAKIAVSPEQMIKIAAVIQENVEKYAATRELREKGVTPG